MAFMFIIKSHIDAFTRKDGSVVQAHEDSRQAAQPVKFGHGQKKAALAHAAEQSEKTGVKHVVTSKEEVDEEGFNVNNHYVAPERAPEKTEKPKGMSLEEAKAHITESNKRGVFGHSWDDIERMQGGKLKR